MHSLVRTAFSKLHTLNPDVEEAKLAAASEEAAEGEIKMTVSAQNIPAEEEPTDPGEENQKVEDGPGMEAKQEHEQKETSPTRENVPDEVQSFSAALFTNRPACMNLLPYSQLLLTPSLIDGLPSILELLRVLINVLDPNDQQHTDSTRLVALGILNTAFEESGIVIADFPSLKALIVDPGCKFLFQLARSENMSILQGALRAISTILVTTRKHLKLQQELFLAFTIDRLATPFPGPNSRGSKKSQFASPRPGTPGTPTLEDGKSDSEKVHTPSKVHAPPARGEVRDLILETLSHISDQPSFMVDLYTNYDCDINCENLFERLIDFLTNVSMRQYHVASLSDSVDSRYKPAVRIFLTSNNATHRFYV